MCHIPMWNFKMVGAFTTCDVIVTFQKESNLSRNHSKWSPHPTHYTWDESLFTKRQTCHLIQSRCHVPLTFKLSFCCIFSIILIFCHLLKEKCSKWSLVTRNIGKVGPRIKRMLWVWKRASPCQNMPPYHTFITIWFFPFKPLKNGIILREILFFSELKKK